MKKIILLGTALCMSLGIVACSKTEKDQPKGEIQIKQEEKSEEKYLTQEEMENINANVENAMREGVKYKFAKIIGVQDTKLEVVFVETPENYKDKGYNEDLNIDTSTLKETKEKDTIELIGVETNIMPEELKSGIEGIYIRIGTFEPEKYDSNIGIDAGVVISIDRVQ